MNILNRFLLLISPLFLLFAASPVATAADPGERPLIPVGLADGQTLRVVALNLATNRTVKLSVTFLDSDGNLVLSTQPTTIASRKMAEFDLPRASVNSDTGRVQIRPVAILTDRSSVGFIHVTIEVFNNDDGRTTVLWDGPPVL